MPIRIDASPALEPHDRFIAEMPTPELLAMLLGSALIGAPALIAVAAAIDAGDRSIGKAFPEEIASQTGLSHERARVLAAAFEVSRRGAVPPNPRVLRSPADVRAIAQRRLGGLRREQILVIVCDQLNRPLRTVTVATGGIDRCTLPIREALNAVLRFDGRGFAVAHNHPGGTVQPSDADIDATRVLAAAARVVGLRFLGHVVISDTEWSIVSPQGRELRVK